jgi:hypothetical protein
MAVVAKLYTLVAVAKLYALVAVAKLYALVAVAKLYALVVVARVPQKSVKNPEVVLLISTARHIYSMQGYHSAFSSLCDISL